MIFESWQKFSNQSANGFSAPFGLDRNDKGGGIILYVRENIPSRLVSTKSFFVEINVRNEKKWLFCCSFNLKKDLITQHFYALMKKALIYLPQNMTTYFF